MLTRIYQGLWLLFAVALGAFMFAGALTGWTAYMFGTACFGLVFFGMMFVLPYNITHGQPAKLAAAPRAKAKLQAIRERWEPTDTAMRQLKYH